MKLDYMFEKLNTDLVKKIAARWGATPKLGKVQNIDYIRQSFNDPAKVRAFLATLTPHEHNALAFAKLLHNRLNTNLLTIIACSTGYLIPADPHHYGKSIAQPLVDLGLFLYRHERGYSHWDNSYYEVNQLVADSRLLAEIGPPLYVPLKITPLNVSLPGTYRPTTTVSLDLINILQAIENIKEFELTKAGTVKASYLRQLKTALGWKKDDLELNELIFENALTAIFSALQQTPLFEADENSLVFQQTTEKFAQQEIRTQINDLMSGFIYQTTWFEMGKPSSLVKENYPAARLALLATLGSLPQTPQVFFPFAEFEALWFERLSPSFSLHGTILNRSVQTRSLPEDIMKKVRQDWLAHEAVWLEKALTSWVYYLGLVELQLQQKRVLGIRLTPLGQALLHHPQTPESLNAIPVDNPQSAWIVQPNFDIIVYIEKASASQLVFLERFTQRTQVQTHIAQYHITRDSVYTGLERGGNIKDFIERLQQHALVPLPQNVLIDLQEWAEQYTQITIHVKSQLIEYHSAQDRDLFSVHLTGKPIGDRFFLLSHPLDHWPEIRLDYDQPLPRCLSVNEEGLIKVKRSQQDLLLFQQLNKWAEARTSHMWQLTQASVSQAIAAKGNITELFALLQTRLLVPRLPGLLEQALHAWSGKKLTLTVGDVTVVHCTNPDLIKAIAKSPMLRPYLHGVLAPDLLLVKRTHVNELKEKLTWAGLWLDSTLTLSNPSTETE